MSPIRYRIATRDPHAHRFTVDCTVDEPSPDGQRFVLPTWIPGSYLIREFARHVVAASATAAGGAVRIEKIAKDTWQVAPCRGPLTVSIDVYAFDLSVRTAYLDAARGYFNGAAVFLRPEGRPDAPCMLEIAAPTHAGGESWRVATTLSRDGAPAWGFGRYRAADYDELIDHPVEMADFAHVGFEAGGAVHDVTVSGRARFDSARLAHDLARVCQWQCDLFGGEPRSRAPFDRYLFQVTAVGEGYGGLEHRTSTSLLCSRRDLPVPGVERVTDEYRTFLGLASHEYFHLWNVKRIKPARFAPYDLAREAYTRQLWAFEGITSYYDDLALVRSGVIGEESWLELAGRTLTSVLRTPGRRLQSVAEASFDAWIKYYRQDENSPNAGVSYYAKGALVAMALDLTLREGGSSLDQLMRALWQRHGLTGSGVPEDGIRRLAVEYGGGGLDAFFDAYVDGTDELPLESLLGGHGVTMSLRPSRGPKDRGGKRGDGVADRVSLGATWSREARLQHVFSGGAAERAGLAAGDMLVALDGVRVNADRLEALVADANPGEGIAVHAFRRDELIETTLVPEAAAPDTVWLAFDESASPQAVARRRLWLSG